jgi:hypothetical protein
MFQRGETSHMCNCGGVQSWNSVGPAVRKDLHGRPSAIIPQLDHRPRLPGVGNQIEVRCLKTHSQCFSVPLIAEVS